MVVQYETAKDIVLASIKENFPSIDTSIGTPTREILVNIGAFLSTILQDQIDNFVLTQSLKSIESAGTADSDVLDAILSNWFVSKNEGSKATGYLRLVYTTNIPHYIPADTAFTTTGGLEFSPSSDILIEPADTAASTSTKLYPLTADTFYALIPVEAAEEGVTYAIEVGTTLTAELGSDLTSITAWTSFSGATDPETATSAISRVREGLSLRELTTKKAITAVLTDNFTSIKNIKVIGMGDREQQRDRSNLFGIGTGSKVDIYIKTALRERVIEKQVGGTGVITLSAADEVPFYRITKIAKAAYPDLPTSDYTIAYTKDAVTANELPNVIASRYSKYERAVITLNDATYFNQIVSITQDYPEDIHALQTFVNDSEDRTVCADLLVRGSIPCYVTIYVTIDFAGTQDIASLKTLLRTHITNSSEIVATKIADILYTVSTVSKVHTPIKIYGYLYKPDTSSVITTLYSEDVLSIPADYEKSTSSETVSFFPNEIYINE